MSYYGFFNDSTYRVVDGNIVYASDLNNPMAAIKVGISSLVDSIQTGANIKTGADIGIINAYAVNLTAAPESLVDGHEVWFKPTITNSGPATFNLNGLGAKSIRTTLRSVLAGGELLAGYHFLLKYLVAVDSWLVVSSPGATEIDSTRTLVGGDGITIDSTEDSILVGITAGGVDTTQLADGAVTFDKLGTDVFPDVARRTITGGDITTSSQVITVSPFGCWDSTGTVWLETSGDSTWEVPATNNLEVYLFAVRATSGGAISIKGYTTLAGPASDGANVNSSRFLSWGRNNGSGVLMPFRQLEDEVMWTDVSNRPVVTTSVSVPWTNYSLSAIIPVTLVKYLQLEGNQLVGTATVAISADSSDNQIARLVSNYSGARILCPGSSLRMHSNGSTYVHIAGITLRR